MTDGKVRLPAILEVDTTYLFEKLDAIVERVEVLDDKVTAGFISSASERLAEQKKLDSHLEKHGEFRDKVRTYGKYTLYGFGLAVLAVLGYLGIKIPGII